MTIRFKCTHCHKPLSVKDHLAGKKAACPVCKKSIAIPVPVPTPVDVEAFAAEALADKPAEKPAQTAAAKTIDFTCPFCDEELKLPADLSGKKTPCPKCTKVIKVPVLEVSKPKDWRATHSGGPSAALANLPEQLSDAWGTEQKGKVSRTAMEEAGALPQAPAQPRGVAGWLRLGAWVGGVGAVVVFLILWAMRTTEEKRQTNHLEEAKKFLSKMPPLHQAEYFRATGEIEVRNRRATDAQGNFMTARSLVPPATDDAAKTFERDLFLLKLATTQIELGGTGDDILKRPQMYRLDWKDVNFQKDLRQTLDAIRTPEAKASAARALACLLMDRDQSEVAIGLAAHLANGNPALEAQQTALLLARKDDGAATELPPPEADKPITDTKARIAYTEGCAYKHEYAAALKYARADGPPAGRLEACVAAASIVLADAKNKDAAKEALPFIEAGLEAYEKLAKGATEQPPSWPVLELIRLGSRTDAADRIASLVKAMPAPFRPLAELNNLEGQLLRTPTKLGEISRVDDVGDEQHPARFFAWEMLARHNARLGSSLNIEDVPEPFQAAAHLGVALGEQDRKK
jgi:hypothetical protein